MSQLLDIDFVSDLSCPWCAIGLASGVNSMSTLVIDRPYVITGCHPVEGLAQALRQLIEISRKP